MYLYFGKKEEENCIHKHIRAIDDIIVTNNKYGWTEYSWEKNFTHKNSKRNTCLSQSLPLPMIALTIPSGRKRDATETVKMVHSSCIIRCFKGANRKERAEKLKCSHIDVHMCTFSYSENILTVTNALNKYFSPWK